MRQVETRFDEALLVAAHDEGHCAQALVVRRSELPLPPALVA
jgi:hypothetical protein